MKSYRCVDTSTHTGRKKMLVASAPHGIILVALGFSLVVKLLLMALFSSAYQDDLFIPFVKHFLDTLDNPWQYFYVNPSGVEFPYHPLMLYVLSLCYAPYNAMASSTSALGNIFFQLPTIVADTAIFYLLARIFPRRVLEIIGLYFLSPILLYAAYMHSQIDIIPTALLFYSVYKLVQNKFDTSALLYGAAICTKFHVVAALPLALIYLLKNNGLQSAVRYIGIIALVYLIVCFPYLTSDGFMNLVLANRKQSLIFSSVYEIGSMRIYLPVLAMLLIYSRFALYKKINHDLLYSYVAILLSVFVLIIEPSPGWYLWILPFCFILFLRLSKQEPHIYMAWLALNAAYIVFYLFFYVGEFTDLTFLGHAVNLKSSDPRLANISFTALEAVLLGNIFMLHRYGVRSNAIYKPHYATIIGISGDSGSGKSTLLRDIRDAIGAGIFDSGEGLLGLEGDGDHKWERGHDMWSRYTHLNPKANYLHQQADNLMALKRGSRVYRSDYDHSTGTFTTACAVDPQQYIVMSGLHTLYLPKMRKLLDVKIFLDTDEKLRRHWKISRDTSKRGYDSERIVRQLELREEDSKRYIQPQRRFADMVLRYFTDDDFTLGDSVAEPRIKLQVDVDASLPLEQLVLELEDAGTDITWEYSEDLQTQCLVVSDFIEKDTVERISRTLISNIEEVAKSAPKWASGHRRLVQLLLLLVLSEKMKAKGYES
ncbi:hypothetical protein DQK91_15200 [Oceanidesulfovibrio marinus]|uniref:phosphoribulokinase n=2 Tax=Oceanidesulfovibrio marinus TaxID=370038 RepID=A0A6P1ZFQ9_9BACT|nr:hypothetical protein DQK91_15200 [Oceanidesulfovibrio marinus]